jgi:ABC-type sugar transport system ATPase subunit
MRDGVLQQVGAPLEVYRAPVNQFVAGFIGSPAMNFFPCLLERESGRSRLVSPWFSIDIDGPPGVTRELVLGIRPRDIGVVENGSSDLVGRVDSVQPLGGETLVDVALGAGGNEQIVRVLLNGERTMKEGSEIKLEFRREAIHLFGADRLRVGAGAKG